MKKIILILTLAAFACSPMLVSQAQAGQKHTHSAKGKHHHHKKGHKKHKK